MVSRPARDPDGAPMPSYAQVFATRGYLPLFLAASLSTWGDFLARVTVAAFVFQQTRSPLAAAATFAVSLLPTLFGRSLLAPLADRIPYKYVLIASHLARAVLVGALIVAVGSGVSLGVLFALLFALELAGGPAPAASQILMTDLFADRRLYVRAMGLGALSEQVNQAVGIGFGGLVVAVVGTGGALWFDLATFMLSAAVFALVARARPPVGAASAGVFGFFADIMQGARYLLREPVLVYLLALSLCTVWAGAAPEAVAIAYAAGKDPSGSVRLGGLLMAAPMLGAVFGLLVVGRWAPPRANLRIMPMALLMPLPLVVTAAAPPVLVTWLLWFVCGALQSFMLPLQATFSLVIPAHMRARVFGLGGAASVAFGGVAYLVAGALAQLSSPATAVAICASLALLAIVLLATRAPGEQLRAAVAAAYGP